MNPLYDPIVWDGDPTDDCTTEWCGMVGRAELMGTFQAVRADEGPDEEVRWEGEDWWCAVFGVDGEVWSSSRVRGAIGGGQRARELVELVMRLEAAKRVGIRSY